MRINVYSQEITDEVLLIEKKSNTGLTYSAVQFILHSSDKLHQPPKDDDRSAVTFWLPKSIKNRALFAGALQHAARLVMEAPLETGSGDESVKSFNEVYNRNARARGQYDK